MKIRTLAAAALLIAASAPGAVQAQHGHDGHRTAQRKMLEYQRDVLMQMVDSMPEVHFRDSDHAGQRNFAQQIHHAAGAQNMIVRGLLQGNRTPDPRTDTTAINIYSRADLRNMVQQTFDSSIEVFDAQTEEQRHAEINLFGQTIPTWQFWDEIFTHTVWTAGQLVGNFRKHGMGPPSFKFF